MLLQFVVLKTRLLRVTLKINIITSHYNFIVIKNQSYEYTDVDVEQFIENMINGLGPYLEKITGEKVSLNLSKRNLESIKKVIINLIEYNKKLEELNKKTFPKEFKISQSIKLLEKIYKLILDAIKPTLQEDMGDPIMTFLALNDPEKKYGCIIDDPEYIAKTRAAIRQIMISIHEKHGNFDKINKFFNSVSNDIFSVSQSAIRLNKKLLYVFSTKKKVTKAVITKYVDSYKEISAFMEHLIAMLYGLHQLLNGKFESYQEIRKKPTGKLINELKNLSLFGELIDPYNFHIRNAIIHNHYYLSPTESQINFQDREVLVTLTYDEFVDYVRNVTRKIAVISHFDKEIPYLIFQTMLELRKQFV